MSWCTYLTVAPVHVACCTPLHHPQLQKQRISLVCLAAEITGEILGFGFSYGIFSFVLQALGHRPPLPQYILCISHLFTSQLRLCSSFTTLNAALFSCTIFSRYLALSSDFLDKLYGIEMCSVSWRQFKPAVPTYCAKSESWEWCGLSLLFPITTGYMTYFSLFTVPLKHGEVIAVIKAKVSV